MFWTVILCISLIVGAQAIGDDDGWKLFLSALLIFTSGVWLVRIFRARQGHRRQEEREPSA
ncbi:hypothetical protein [Geodermatophilus nigrescens]